MKTRAAILTELNKPLTLDDVEIPSLECGQVLVQIHCSGICGAQLGEISGTKGPDKFLPHLMGHEGGGTVLDVGPGVTHIKRGDHVVMHWRKGLGINAQPPKYMWQGNRINAGWVTTFNEAAVISENRLTPIPGGVSFEIAALMGCAVTTALGLINNDADLKIGQSIAIFGCGGVGLSVIQGASLVSGFPIIGVDIVEEKLEMARRFGASHTVNSKADDVKESVRRIVGSGGADVVIETTGNVRLIELAYELTSSKGRTVMVGVPRHDEDITIHSLPLHFGKVLTGCEGGHSNPAEDIPRYLRLWDSGRLSLDKLVTERHPFSAINTAIERLQKGQVAGRCVLTM